MGVGRRRSGDAELKMIGIYADVTVDCAEISPSCVVILIELYQAARPQP